jgi:hypothetical protein
MEGFFFCEKKSLFSLPGSEPRNVEPASSRYTDCAISDSRQYNINLSFVCVLCLFVPYLSFVKLKDVLHSEPMISLTPVDVTVRNIIRIREVSVWILTGTSVILSGICHRISLIDDPNAGIVTRIVHDRFFPDPTPFTIHQLF